MIVVNSLFGWDNGIVNGRCSGKIYDRPNFDFWAVRACRFMMLFEQKEEAGHDTNVHRIACYRASFGFLQADDR